MNEVVPFWSWFRERDQRAGDGSGTFPLLSVSQTRGVLRRSELADEDRSPSDLSAYKVVRAGDVVLNRMSAYKGAVGVAREAGVVSPDYLVMAPTPLADADFIAYTLKSYWFLFEMTSRLRGIGSADSLGVRTPRISRRDLGLIPVPDLSAKAQRSIASSISAAAGEIDTFIADQEQLIALLEERRVALQRSLVLRGISQARTRPSGVSWAGPIPEAWEVVALRRLARCRDDVRVPKNAQERAEMVGSIPYWGANSIQGYVDRALISGPLTLIGEDGAPFFDQIAPVAFAIDEPIWPNNHVHVLRAGPRVTHQYLALYLNLVDYSLFVKGSTRDKLNQADLMSIPVTVPSPAEQHAIVAQLTAETTSTDASIADAREAIALSRERRAVLISAAVTGRIDLTERKRVLV